MSRPETAARTFPPVFAALGDPTRLRLVTRLSDGRARSITELTRALPRAKGTALTRQAVTKHLRVLEEAGLVRSEAVGRENRFVLEPQRLTQAAGYLEQVSRRWDEALARLRALVEE